MAYYPFGQELGAKYVLTGPGGTTAVFNDPSDPNYVGMLKEVSGFDSPEVRETSDDLVQADGGIHGDFWFGRRVITMNGIMFNVTAVQRDLMMDRLQRASMAMRGDGTLTWKPAIRQENLLPYGNWETNSLTGWSQAAFSGSVTGTGALSAAYAHSGTRSFLINATHDATTTAGSVPSIDGRSANSNANRYPVRAGVTYTASMYVNITNAATVASGIRLRLYWYQADGTPSVVNSSDTGVYTSAATVALVRPSITATAPSDAAYGAVFIEPLNSWTTISDTYSAYYDSIMVNEGTTPLAYFDGNTAGYYWQGNANASGSGDFVEMLTTVRRQQPLRFTGGWNKEFQLQLVSEYAGMFSNQALSVAGTGVTAENRGSYYSFPVFTITGAGTPTQVAITGAGGGIVKFTGLVLAAGETVSIDMFTHTAIFTAGTRNGQSANRYIDFTGTTTWPYLGTGINTITLSGTGTLVTTWRDTWV